jgi:acyl-CoA reductase-like NAD-dependent aldehyde dehydrogenase
MSNILEVTNPRTGEIIGSMPLKSGEEIKAMIKKANEVKSVWANTPLYQRTQIMYKFCDILAANVDDIARTLSTEMGKPIVQSTAETAGSVCITRGFVERANHLYGELLPTGNQPGKQNDVIFTMREPLGVIACIIPFNFPIELFVHKVAPALIMGNVCIVKAPSACPLAMCKLEGLLLESGVPEGVIQCLACTKEDSTKYLVSDPGVNAISLTGSTRAGIEMAKAGADTLKHIFLELGGNDANIIFEDADLDFAVESMIAGRLLNSGQTCCACKRFIVQRSIQDELVKKLVARLKTIKMGDALDPQNDLSCLVTEKAAVDVEKQIRKSVEQGAKLACGGQRDGAFITPAVLWDVKKDNEVAVDMEIFGPAFPIIPFDTEEEAIAIANQTQYGLSSGIITKDLKRAMKVASKIQAGSVVLNGQSNYRHMEQAFGGYKMTGLGREGISSTLEEFSQVKNYIIQNVFDN